MSSKHLPHSLTALPGEGNLIFIRKAAANIYSEYTYLKQPYREKQLSLKGHMRDYSNFIKECFLS